MKLRKYLLESEMKLSKEERKSVLESIRNFGQFRKEIFRESGIVNEKTGRPVPFSQRLKEITEQIGQIIEAAEGLTLKETEGWFDQISVNRDLKEIKTDYKIFEKTCMEMAQMQQRLESIYENMDVKLKKYYEI